MRPQIRGHGIIPCLDRKRVDRVPVIARGVVEASKAELRWMDSSNRGYMMLSLTPQAATNEWVFMDTVKDLSLGTKRSHKMKVRPGRKVLEAA